MASSKIAKNEELLLEMLEHFSGGIYDFDNSYGLSNFMLSGREPFNAALNYFSRADRIIFRDYGLDICVKKATHCFGYDWELLDTILKVTLPSVYHLCVYDSPKHDKGYKIMDQLLFKNDLKHLTLFADLPECYINKLNEYKIETIRLQHQGS